MTTPTYVLLKRNPAMTKEEFSEHWEKKHAPLVIPWAIQYGIEYYAQVHNIRLAPNAPPVEGFAIEEWDGAAQMKVPSPEILAEAFRDPYYLNVILPDERRFLVSEAKQHMKLVPLDAITGDKKVIIGGEKALIEDQETRAAKLEALELWREMWGGVCG